MWRVVTQRLRDPQGLGTNPDGKFGGGERTLFLGDMFPVCRNQGRNSPMSRSALNTHRFPKPAMVVPCNARVPEGEAEL